MTRKTEIPSMNPPGVAAKKSVMSSSVLCFVVDRLVLPRATS
jgi:hypothetical protein